MHERELSADDKPHLSKGASESDAQSAGRLSRICALAIIGLCVVAAFEAFKLDAWTFDGPGPGLLPQILLPLIAMAAIAVAISPGEISLEGGAAAVLSNRNFLAYAVGMVMTAAAVPLTGFILAGMIAVLLMMRFGERQGWAVSFLWAIVLVGSITLVFGVMLGVPFPPGPIESGLTKLGLLRAG